jgi:hypothetical protein
LKSIVEEDDRSLTDSARLLEVFLDYLLAEATRGTSPLLDHAFDGVLTDDERAVRKLLEDLQAKATPKIRQSPAWHPIAETLEELGAPPMQQNVSMMGRPHRKGR